MDKIAKIKAELERLYKEESHKTSSTVLHQLHDFINSLQEEQESDDLEEEIEKWYKSDIGIYKTREQFGKMICHFTQLQKQKTIDKAVSFILETSKGLERDEDVKQFIDDFRKTMEKD